MAESDLPESTIATPGLRFQAPPVASSAWVCAVLEPAVAVGVFLLLAQAMPQRGPEAVTQLDRALLLLMLALMFPSPDRLFTARAQRWSEAVINAVLLAAVLLLCAWAVRGLQLMTLPLWAAWAVLVPLVHQSALEAVSTLWQRRANRRAPPRAVVVGAGAVGRRTARALRRLQGPQARRFLGWVDPGLMRSACRRRRLGGLQALVGLVQSGGVEEVYLTVMPSAQADASFDALWQALQDSTVTVRWVPDVLSTLVVRGQVSTLDGLPVIGLLESPFAGVHAALKRVSDIALALVALLLLWPLMLALAAAVRLDSPGPALFRQRRLGCEGRVIEVWKFRTMTVTEDGPQIRQATQGDARVTRLGRILRRTSLDELPQFINVLQGRMSVVGPRPHALAHNDLYRGLVKAYMVRHKVRPGITGWAQVNGFRGETDTVEKMRRRVEYDLHYLQNWSLALDLQIVLRTVGLVFRDAHAW